VTRRLEPIVLCAVALADQLAKQLVVSRLGLLDSVAVIPGLLSLTHVRNSGVAFGFLNSADFAFKQVVMAVLALAALVGVGLYAVELPLERRWARTGLALILGGAAGNLVDRARQGFVVDFVDVYWRGWHFWAFNVADAAISVGVAILVVDLLRPARPVPAA
jgi:signal peptidase II